MLLLVNFGSQQFFLSLDFSALASTRKVLSRELVYGHGAFLERAKDSAWLLEVFQTVFVIADSPFNFSMRKIGATRIIRRYNVRWKLGSSRPHGLFTNTQ